MKHVVVFQCPLCGNKVHHDGEGLEPCCTGPTWRDEHPLEVMVMVERKL